jgi:protoporphyrinogen/coproporphyrinogen III oxidase
MKGRVAIIGGGISGLCVAYRLQRAGVDATLFESGDRVGGNINTQSRDGFLFEDGPNTLMSNVELFELVRDLQLTDKILLPSPAAKKRYIVRDGRLTALPAGPLDIFTTAAFSAGGRLRLLKEPLVRSRSNGSESVASFFQRRLGTEIADYAVDPFISGIYAGDPDKLSIRSAFPRLYEMEKGHGSLLKGALFGPKEKKKRLPKGAPRTYTFKDGMQTLTETLREKLGDNVKLATPVERIVSNEGRGYRLETATGSEDFDAVALCTPARAAARLLDKMDGGLAGELSRIYYPPIAVIYTGFKKEQVRIEPNGFGVLVPAAEHRRILGCLWTSSVFENRAPAGYHLFTSFIGGSRNAALCEKSEDALVDIAVDEISSIMNVDGQPEFTAIKKWERSIPQYNIGYESVVDAIEVFERSNPGFVFCSNFYKGISVGDCVKNSISASEEILQFINSDND